MFLERVCNGSYLNMAAHPNGSARVFLSTQAGKVFLATVPPREICHYRSPQVRLRRFGGVGEGFAVIKN
jgi:hypothetical protein